VDFPHLVCLNGDPSRTSSRCDLSGSLPDEQITSNPVQPLSKKDSAFPKPQITLITPAIPSHYRGAFRDRHLTFGRAAVDADGAADESTRCGRRSRVVLTPRRWRQVGGGNSANDGVNKPITGEITYKL
jgi:hypothetical protein